GFTPKAGGVYNLKVGFSRLGYQPDPNVVGDDSTQTVTITSAAQFDISSVDAEGWQTYEPNATNPAWVSDEHAKITQLSMVLIPGGQPTLGTFSLRTKVFTGKGANVSGTTLLVDESTP